MPEAHCQHAVVIGTGLIGGSIGLAIRRAGFAGRVTGVVRSPQSVRRALDAGVVDDATEDLSGACRGADLVVVCTPVASVSAMVIEALRQAAPDALVTDAASTKAKIVERVALAGDAARFVGAHPLAGDTRTGPEAARADLFDGAMTVVTPTDATPPEAAERAVRFWETLGSRVVAMTPQRHDELLALTSHVPHVAAAAVAATTPEGALELAATGWADTTRVAAGSTELWREILMDNPAPVANGLRRLAEELTRYAEALDGADADKIQELLQQGKQRRDALGN